MTFVEHSSGEGAGWDECKIFVSRVPPIFTEASIKRLIEEKVGKGSVTEVALKYPLTKKHETNNDSDNGESEEGEEEKDQGDETEATKQEDHRGFAFVTLASFDLKQTALEFGTIRGGAKSTSTKKHTIYLRDVQREVEKPVCFLWEKFRCPYGHGCKFAHEGEGGFLDSNQPSSDPKKRKKCFNYRKGKCKLGEDCPFSHDFEVENKPVEKRPDNEKDCFGWKTKGKCRKGDKCPYRHDPEVQMKALKKQEKKKQPPLESKQCQPLSVRVFGLNYDTTEDDVWHLFQACGKITEVTFPKFEDSGRSKGYCGVLFQSPKAVTEAVKLDGAELHGRWLRIQAGKMYLKQWENNESKAREKRGSETDNQPLIGEFGQKVKRRRKHGFKE